MNKAQAWRHKNWRTPCSGCGMNEEIAKECASSGDCEKQKKEYPEEWIEWPVYDEAKGG